MRDAIRYLAVSDPYVLEPQMEQVRRFLKMFDPLTATALLDDLEKKVSHKLPPKLEALRIGLRGFLSVPNWAITNGAFEMHMLASAAAEEPEEQMRQEILAHLVIDDRAKIKSGFCRKRQSHFFQNRQK